MLLCVAYFIIFVHYIAYSFLHVHVHTGTHVAIERLNHVLDLNIWCVYVESLLNVCILLHTWLLVFIHINIYPLLT